MEEKKWGNEKKEWYCVTPDEAFTVSFKKMCTLVNFPDKFVDVGGGMRVKGKYVLKIKKISEK